MLSTSMIGLELSGLSRRDQIYLGASRIIESRHWPPSCGDGIEYHLMDGRRSWEPIHDAFSSVVVPLFEEAFVRLGWRAEIVRELRCRTASFRDISNPIASYPVQQSRPWNSSRSCAELLEIYRFK
jgi:hypothetical protein